jgi:hypothetical protein
MELCCSGDPLDGGVDVPVGARDENVLLRAFHAKHAANDLRNLLGCFATAEDHFSVALPQSAMVVNFGEAEVFKGHVAQAVEGLRSGQATSAESLQQIAEIAFVHGRKILSPAVRSVASAVTNALKSEKLASAAYRAPTIMTGTPARQRFLTFDGAAA